MVDNKGGVKTVFGQNTQKISPAAQKWSKTRGGVKTGRGGQNGPYPLMAKREAEERVKGKAEQTVQLQAEVMAKREAEERVKGKAEQTVQLHAEVISGYGPFDPPLFSRWSITRGGSKRFSVKIPKKFRLRRKSGRKQGGGQNGKGGGQNGPYPLMAKREAEERVKGKAEQTVQLQAEVMAKREAEERVKARQSKRSSSAWSWTVCSALPLTLSSASRLAISGYGPF